MLAYIMMKSTSNLKHWQFVVIQTNFKSWDIECDIDTEQLTLIRFDNIKSEWHNFVFMWVIDPVVNTFFFTVDQSI